MTAPPVTVEKHSRNGMWRAVRRYGKAPADFLVLCAIPDEAQVRQYAFECNARDHAVELVETLAKLREVTMVLGAGVKHIAVPDGFFAWWNETEIKAAELIVRVKGKL